jgi:hypothetical protein
VTTHDEVMDSVDRVLDCVTALEPMAEILVESGVTIPLNLTGAALLFTAVTGEMLRTRSLVALTSCARSTARRISGAWGRMRRCWRRRAGCCVTRLTSA